MLSVVHALVVAAAILLTSMLTRPPAASFAAEVARRKARAPAPKSAWTKQLAPLRSAWAVGDMGAAWGVVRSRSRIRTRDWEDPDAWAIDAVFLSYGCYRGRRTTCFVGTAGRWYRQPTWTAAADLWSLMAVHAISFACYHYSPTTYFRYFEPSTRRPHSIPLAAFATSSVFSMLWLGSTLLSLGPDLQRLLGRRRFARLYLGAGLASTCFSLAFRHSATGAGGAIATIAYHALAAPHARHDIMGVPMGARTALAVHVGIASMPALGAAAHVAGRVLAINLVPVAIGAGAYMLRE